MPDNTSYHFDYPALSSPGSDRDHFDYPIALFFEFVIRHLLMFFVFELVSQIR